MIYLEDSFGGDVYPAINCSPSPRDKEEDEALEDDEPYAPLRYFGEQAFSIFFRSTIKITNRFNNYFWDNIY